jgi:hypothetical protein
MWRHCNCGHDFGPSDQTTRLGPERAEKPLSEEEWLTAERINRYLRRLYFGSLIILLLTYRIHSLHWVTSAMAFIQAIYFWAPSGFWKIKNASLKEAVTANKSAAPNCGERSR